MPHLQMHQLRVAAVAKQICESLDVKIDTGTIIKTCLLHDMGNVIKFDLNQTKSVFGLSDKEVEEIRKIKNEFINKYGENEHDATIAIIKELNLNTSIANLADKNRFGNLCIDKDGNDWALKIIHYADARVGPHNILSYDERMNDAGNRYRGRIDSIKEQERQKLVDCGKQIENQIFAHSNIKPEDIHDESIKDDIEKLKNFEI